MYVWSTSRQCNGRNPKLWVGDELVKEGFHLQCAYSLQPIEIVEDSRRPFKVDDTHTPRSFRSFSDSDIGAGTIYFRLKPAETCFLWPRVIGNPSCAAETRQKQDTARWCAVFSTIESVPARPRSSKTREHSIVYHSNLGRHLLIPILSPDKAASASCSNTLVSRASFLIPNRPVAAERLIKT